MAPASRDRTGNGQLGGPRLGSIADATKLGHDLRWKMVTGQALMEVVVKMQIADWSQLEEILFFLKTHPR